MGKLLKLVRCQRVVLFISRFRFVEGRNEGAWPRGASRAYLIGRRPGSGCCTLEGQGIGYGTQPHDWKLSELESMENSLCLWGAHLWEASCDPIHRRQPPEMPSGHAAL
jgi:hypothetical protein